MRDRILGIGGGAIVLGFVVMGVITILKLLSKKRKIVLKVPVEKSKAFEIMIKKNDGEIIGKFRSGNVVSYTVSVPATKAWLVSKFAI